MSKIHPDDPRITAYVLNELDDDERNVFEQALVASAELRTAVDEVRATIVRLESAFAEEAAAFDSHEEATVPVTSSEAAVPSPDLTEDNRKGSPRSWFAILTIAAIVLLSVSMAVIQWQNRSDVALQQNDKLSSGTDLIYELDQKNDSTNQNRKSVEQSIAQDVSTKESESLNNQFDELTDLITETTDSETWVELRGEDRVTEFASNLSAVVSNTSEVEDQDLDLDGIESNDMLMVTPRIIVEDGEESILGESLVENKTPYAVNNIARQTTSPQPRPEIVPIDNLVTGTYVKLPKHIGGPTGATSSPFAGDVALSQKADGYYDNLQYAAEHPIPGSSLALRSNESIRGGRRFRIDARRYRGINPPTDEGIGPDFSGDQFEPIYENEFQKVTDSPLSTFSIDVDTASYSKVRQYLLESNQLPRPDAVRIEELVNYFSYRYESPTTEDPFSSNMEIASCPWKPEHRLVRIGLKGKEFAREERPATNLVFLLDVSGSMDQPNKLPLLKKSMKLLVNQLGENDRVAMVVYAGAAGLVLDSTTANHKPQILGALDELHAGGSTNGGEGIRLAYQTALDHFIKGGSNRVILCTDGDFNVGTTGTDELVRLAEQNAKTGVFLSVFGFGMGNHNDSMLEQISNKGNGNYGFIDNEQEAKKSFVEQLTGTLVTIAKDVKIQIEFNPAEVSAYRLIGYENRILAAQDFNDDTKDAGEIGAGHTVTALYEIIPAGADSEVNVPPIDELKYQQKPAPAAAATDSGELLTLKIRYKQPDGDTSKLLSFPITDNGKDYAQSSTDYRFAAAVASFGMMLRDSKFKGNATWDSVLELAVEGSRDIDDVYRTEFVELVKQAKTLAGAGESKPTPASRGAGR